MGASTGAPGDHGVRDLICGFLKISCNCRCHHIGTLIGYSVWHQLVVSVSPELFLRPISPLLCFLSCDSCLNMVFADFEVFLGIDALPMRTCKQLHPLFLETRVLKGPPFSMNARWSTFLLAMHLFLQKHYAESFCRLQLNDFLGCGPVRPLSRLLVEFFRAESA